jgi:hypothetical protein
METDDLRGATQLSGRLAVPQGEQDVAVSRQKYAALRILQVAGTSWLAD